MVELKGRRRHAEAGASASAHLRKRPKGPSGPLELFGLNDLPMELLWLICWHWLAQVHTLPQLVEMYIKLQELCVRTRDGVAGTLAFWLGGAPWISPNLASRMLFIDKRHLRTYLPQMPWLQHPKLIARLSECLHTVKTLSMFTPHSDLVAIVQALPTWRHLDMGFYDDAMLTVLTRRSTPIVSLRIIYDLHGFDAHPGRLIEFIAAHGKTLRSLQLEWIPLVRDDMVGPLTHAVYRYCTVLEHLKLHFCLRDYFESPLLHPETRRHLRSVCLEGIDCTTHDVTRVLSELGECPLLEELEFPNGLDSVDSATQLAAILPKWPKLRKLLIPGRLAHPGYLAAPQLQYTQVEELDLNSQCWPSRYSVVQYVTALSQLVHLRSLDLRIGTDLLEAADVFSAFPSLTLLHLTHSYHLTTAALHAIVAALTLRQKHVTINAQCAYRIMDFRGQYPDFSTKWVKVNFP